MAIPAFSMHTVLTGTDDLPRDLSVMKTYDRMQAAFPGGQIPAVVVVKADDVTKPDVRAAIAEMERRAVAEPEHERPGRRDDQPGQDGRHRCTSRCRGPAPTTPRAPRWPTLRDDIIPATVGQLDSGEAFVTGMAAGTKDFNDLTKERAPIVFGFVLALAFLLLLVTFRSIVIPIKAIAAQPAVGRRQLRRARLGLPGRAPRGPAELRVQRRDRELAAACSCS